eukprot:1190089-Prorocentrum_minimum.AAC.6
MYGSFDHSHPNTSRGQEDFNERNTESPVYCDCIRQVDPGLAAHLEAVGAAPQLFLLRWLRLLFSREFTPSQVRTTKV